MTYLLIAFSFLVCAIITLTALNLYIYFFKDDSENDPF